MVMISKGNIEEGSSGIVSLHPGWNILDMNGEFKDSWLLKIKKAIVNLSLFMSFTFLTFVS
jgi:hypothetical protein